MSKGKSTQHRAEHGMGFGKTCYGVRSCMAIAIAGVLAVVAGTASATSTFIHSNHYVTGPDTMVGNVLHEEHVVTDVDAPTDDEMASRPEAGSYGTRLQSVFLQPIYGSETGTQTTSPQSFTAENVDWTYRLVNDSSFAYSVTGGVLAVDHKVTFTSKGETANFGLTVVNSAAADCDSASAAIFIESSDPYSDADPSHPGTVNLNADTTTISAVATGEASSTIHGVNMEHYGTLHMNGKEVTITVQTESNLRPTLEPSDTEPFESFGIFKYGVGDITSSAETVLNINVTGTGDNADNAPLDDITGAADVAANIGGLYTEGGTIDLQGETNITVNGNGNWATGAQLWAVDLEVDSAQSIPDNTDQTTNFGGNTTITVTSAKSQAVGLLVGGLWFNVDATEEERNELVSHVGEVTVTAEKDLTITATNTDGSLGSVGIAFNRWGGADATVNLNGTTVITADQALGVFGDDLIALDEAYAPLKEAVFKLNNSGDLTLNGNVDGYTGTFTQTAGSTTLNTTNGKFFGGDVSVEGGTLTAENASLTLNAESGNLAVKNAALSMHTLTVEASQKLTLQNAEVTAGFFSVEEGVEIDAGGSSFVLNGNDDTDSHIDGTIINLGSIVVNNGTLDLDSNGRMEFVEGSKVTLNGDALLSFTGTMKGGDLVFNDGTYLYTPENPASDTLEIDGGKVVFNGNVHLLGGTRGVEADLEDTIAIKNLVLSHNPDDDEPVPEITFNGGQYDFTSTAVNAGMLTFTGDAGAVTIDDVSVNAGTFAVTGGTVTTTTFLAAGGNANVAGGTLHTDTLNATGAFTMNVTGNDSFVVGRFVGAEGGAFTLASGTMQADEVDLANGLLTVNGGATLSTFSGQLFTTALNAEGTNGEAGDLRYGADHLSFGSGSTLTLRDEFYNVDYVNDAQGLLGDVHITLTGTEVDAQGQEVTEKPLDQMPENTTLVNTTITAEADSNGTVTIGSSVGGKDLVVDEDATSVAVSEDKTFTLVGSSEGGELIRNKNGDAVESVAVSGGLTLGEATADPGSGTISGTISVKSNANLTSQNGEYEVGTVNATDAQVNVSSGSLSVSTLAATNGQINVASGTLAVEDLTLSGTTSLTSGTTGTMQLGTVSTAEGGRHQLKGDITAGTVSGAGTLLVGSATEGESASATLSVTTLDHSGIIFIDPAWVDGAPMSAGSFLTVEELEGNELRADVVAGQNSTFVFGASKDDAVTAFADTNLTYGEEGDVKAVLYVAAPIKVATGSITVDGSMSELKEGFAPADGSVTVAENGLAMFDGSAMEGLAAGEAVITTDGTVTFVKGSHIRLVNLTKSSMGTLIDAGTLTIEEEEDLLTNAVSTSDIVSAVLTKVDNTITFETELKDAAVVFNGFKGASLMNAMHEASANNTDSPDRATRFLSRMASHGDYGVASTSETVDIGNQAMALAATAGVYNVALDSSKLMNRSLERRMTLADNFDRTKGVTVWADVFGTTNQADSLYGDGGYDMDLYGGVLGADVEVVPGAVLGAALTVGTGDGGSKDAAIDVDNDVDFFGLSVYGSHRIGNCNGMIDIGWMHTKSDLSATAFGMSIGDEVKADAFTIGLGAEHLMKFGSVNVVPHVGIRWTRLDVDGYEGAFKTDDDTMNIFTLPIGVAFSGNLNAGGWRLAPMVDLAVVPSFGDDEAESKVYWQGVSETVKTQVVDDAPFQASLGINAQNGNWTIGASYDLGVGGDDRLDNAFTLRARYAF